MMTNTLSNNKLLGIKLAFAVISIVLFYVVKLHIEYQYGRHVPIIIFGIMPILIFYHMISRKLPTNYKGFIFPAIFSLSIFLLMGYFGVYTGGAKSVSVAAAESVGRGIGAAVGVVIGIVIYYIEKYYRRHDFSLESLLTIAASFAVMGYIFIGYAFI